MTPLTRFLAAAVLAGVWLGFAVVAVLALAMGGAR